ncbi:Oidioi.mRNA.OKI2018_I69.chr2.g4086.t1.cds [Oikopleura dioica]|uniref:Oidioi.mRNA.OKI2018_I69.chr2.g4086.t1.cds n=1 Tax=Oikopleura dioica TaxID=34765 RepID=A0ABN7SXU6_OIKDI|nr:Oidioi.mRNA.OKI2018_I69.chr2.g4086.t1.cds [Oikopleura dioica]
MGKENEAFDDVELGDIPKAGAEFQNEEFPLPRLMPFLIKVSLTVCLQMCLLGAMTCWILFDYGTACYISENWWLYWVVILVFPIVACIMACSDKLMRTSPLNIISLVVFSVLMAFMFAFLAGMWSTAGSNCSYDVFCKADEYGCSYGSSSSKCEAVETCVQDAFSVIVPAGIGTASIFFVSLILTVCGFDIFNHMKIVIIIYFVLSWPIGLLGWFLFPIEIYWAMLCVFVIFCGSVGILFTLSLIVNNKYDFSPDEWVRASMYIFMQIGRIFIYLIAIIGGSD